MSASPDAGGVLGRVLAAAERAPGAPAFIVGDHPLAYRDMLALWAGAVGILQSRGVRRGQPVALTMGQSPVQLVMLLAIARLGAVAIPVSPFLDAAKRAAVFARFGIEAAVADRAEFVPPGVASILVPQLEAATDASALGRAGPWPGLDDPFCLALTSGTTGTPKAIALTHGGLARRIRRNVFDAGVVPRMVPPGLHIIVAYSGALYAIFEGGTVVFPRGYDAPSFLAAVRRHEVTHVMLPPANLGNLARASPGPIPSLRQVRFLGGTPSAALVALAHDRLSPNLLTVYASVETATAACADAQILARKPASSGRPCADARIEVVDGEGRAVPAGQQGHLRVQVAEMGQGYFGPDAGDRSRFRDGWFYTSDVGRFDTEGLLFVEGRSDDVINLGGRKFLPVAIEAMLEEHPGVREAAVFLPEGAERLEAAIVADEGLDLTALARFADERLELLAPARFHRVASLPRNAMGKLEREKLGV